MKKSSKTAIIVVAIVGILLIALLIGMFVGLGKTKTPITAETFKEKMEGKGYIVGDVIEQYQSYGYFKQAYIAADKDYSYQIEFYILEDDEYATAFYNTNKTIFENSKSSSGTAETNVNLKNNSKYTLSANGKYKVVSRIDNTVIFVNVDDNQRDTIKNILKELGY
ncbi:MAG: hypothetical protein HFJ54_06250 [Clostridia bacterium]|nr:hypothetical protein [Clostridia bacterium]